MLKVGDIVICIDDKSSLYDDNNKDYEMCLNKYSIYKISHVYKHNDSYVILKEESGAYLSRFITLKEYRKQKLEKLKQ